MLQQNLAFVRKGNKPRVGFGTDFLCLSLYPILLQLSAAVSASGELKIISEQDTDGEAPSVKYGSLLTLIHSFPEHFYYESNIANR